MLLRWKDAAAAALVTISTISTVSTVSIAGCGRDGAGRGRPIDVSVAVGGQNMLIYLPTTLPRELVAFVMMLRFPGLVLATSPRSAETVTRIEELKGRVAGVTALGSSSHMLLSYLLQRHGIDPDAVSIESLNDSMPMFSPDGVMSADGAEAVRHLLAQSTERVRQATIDLSKTYPNEYVKP